MQTSRRKFMTLLGGGIIVAAGAAGGWAATRDPAAARKPWDAAKSIKAANADPRRYALSHAILAPNPHNRQPWIADLSVKDEITLYCDLNRRLAHTDPFDRQITVGLGCFSELLVMAAAEIGYRAETLVFPQGESFPRLDKRPVATFRFVRDENVKRDPLFAHVFDRRSNKETWDASKLVSADLAKQIADSAVSVKSAFTVDAQMTAKLRELAWQSMDIEMRTYRTAKESIDLLRIGKAEIEANPDGIDLPGPFFEALDKVGMMSREDMLDTTSAVFEQQMTAMREPFETAPGFVWIKTSGNSRAAQLAAGRDYIRLNLAATGLGVDMQPWSQALQEFDEMAEKYAEIREVLGIEENETLQMFARIGYGPKVKASPRWPLDSRIRTA